MKLYRPYPINEEIKIRTNELLVTKTDTNGNIIDINENFTDKVGYSLEEIKGTKHNDLRHPDMPEIILFLISKQMEQGKKVRAIVKNLTKSGHYYWATTDFEPNINTQGNLDSFFAFRSAIPSNEIEPLIELYRELVKVEKHGGIEASLISLNSYLKQNRVTFESFMNKMSMPKSILKKLYISSFAPQQNQKALYKRVA